MTLTEFLTLNSKISIAGIQQAYEEVVPKLRLRPASFPVLLSGACRIGGLYRYGETLNGSQIAFKEIGSLDGVTYTNTDPGEYTTATLSIGDQSGEGFWADRLRPAER